MFRALLSFLRAVWGFEGFVQFCVVLLLWFQGLAVVGFAKFYGGSGPETRDTKTSANSTAPYKPKLSGTIVLDVGVPMQGC